MTALIFITETDASPVIYLDAPPDEVRRHLMSPANIYSEGGPPSLAAIRFLRGLTPGQMMFWQPAIESIPALMLSDLDLENLEDDPIAWNPETWGEWPLTLPGPILVETTAEEDRAFAEYAAFNQGRKGPPTGWTHVETSVEPVDPEGRRARAILGLAPLKIESVSLNSDLYQTVVTQLRSVCILTGENMHTADDCTQHDHEPDEVGFGERE